MYSSCFQQGEYKKIDRELKAKLLEKAEATTVTTSIS